jgi:aryl-alcohol dehydrogenase-like predicted oxidoreductase
LTVGPLQKKMPLKEGAQVMAYAFERGINFVDTAQLYLTYPYIKLAMEISGKKDIVIATKTYAYDKKTAMESFDDNGFILLSNKSRICVAIFANFI